MKARVIPYSSVVGSSVVLSESENGPAVAQLAILNVGGDTRDEHKQLSEALAREVALAINARGTRFAVSSLVGS